MPLSIERLDDPEFWRLYFFEAEPEGDEEDDEDDEEDDEQEEADDEEEGDIVEFAVGGGYALVLDIDLELGSVELGLRTPHDDEVLELGWDDQAHWHPHVLRWAELDLIGRAAAVLDSGLPHPGPVIGLAGRFVVLGPDDDLDAITPLVEAAPGLTARDWLYRVDLRHEATTWQRTEAGDWTVDQDEAAEPDRGLYSLRRPDGSFPFVEWRGLLAAAEATLAAGPLPEPAGLAEQCWVDEVRTGAPPGSLVAARFGASPLREARLYSFSLTIPVENRYSYAEAVVQDLDAGLTEASLGTAEITGSSSAPGKGYTSVSVDVSVYDDREAGLALIRNVLGRHGVPS